MRKTFGQVLRQLRKEKGFSQERLAFESELDRAYVGRLERDEMVPSLTTLFALAKALRLKPSEVLDSMGR